MRSLFFILSILAVIGLAFWAYQENYRTQSAIAEVKRLQREIGEMRETETMLKAEWAYLNRPDRLRELVELNYERLGLMPFLADSFGRIEQITYPQPVLEIEDTLGPITNPVNVVGQQEQLP